MYQMGLLTVLTVILLDCAAPTAAPTPFPFIIEIASPEPTLDVSNCSTTICCSDCMEISVDRIIDGDTFQSANARIMLFGVDTPERGDQCFNEATERFKELAGDTVRMEFGPRQQDRYGRILYQVYNENGESIDEMLVREGLALAWTRDGQHWDVLVAAEEGARRGQRCCLW